MDDEQYINIEDGLSVGAIKYVDTNEMITEEEFNYIKNKVHELEEIVNTWEAFKSSGGEINGDIKLPRGFALCGTINGNRDALIYQSNQPNDNGRVIVGSSGQTTQIASELRPEVYWNLQTHHIILDSDFVSNKSDNGYTKLPNGVIIQWGRYNQHIVPRGTHTTEITMPICYPNGNLFSCANVNYNITKGSDSHIEHINVSVNRVNSDKLKIKVMDVSNLDVETTFEVFWFSLGY